MSLSDDGRLSTRGAGWLIFTRFRRFLRNLRTDLSWIIWPAQCLSCGRWDAVLCADCETHFLRTNNDWGLIEVECSESSPEDSVYVQKAVPCLSLGFYEGCRRRIIIAAKHDQQFYADALLRRAGLVLGKNLGNLGLHRLEPVAAKGEIWVVPAPSSWKRRLRGSSVTQPFAEGIAEALAEVSGRSSRVIEAVGLRVGATSQAGKDSELRRSGRAGQFFRRVEVPKDVSLVVVDDVVASGATIEEMLRCLEHPVMAVLCMARSQR